MVAGRDEAGGGAAPLAKVAPAVGLHWMLLPLLVLPLASVPLVSEDSALLRELRLASEGKASRRGGILSLMRSRPFASSKLVILCWGEKPLMAVEMQEKGKKREKLGGIHEGRDSVINRMRSHLLTFTHTSTDLLYLWFVLDLSDCCYKKNNLFYFKKKPDNIKTAPEELLANSSMISDELKGLYSLLLLHIIYI